MVGFRSPHHKNCAFSGRSWKILAEERPPFFGSFSSKNTCSAALCGQFPDFVTVL
jgi:hypothetical protein